MVKSNRKEVTRPAVQRYFNIYFNYINFLGQLAEKANGYFHRDKKATLFVKFLHFKQVYD